MHHSSKSTMNNGIHREFTEPFRALRIRKSNLKYTSQKEIIEELYKFCRQLQTHLVDYGIHNGGKYNQCHIHALVQDPGMSVYGRLQQGAYNIYWEPIKNLRLYDQYMHKEDKNSQAAKDNMAIENYYIHHYITP